MPLSHPAELAKFFVIFHLVSPSIPVEVNGAAQFLILTVLTSRVRRYASVPNIETSTDRIYCAALALGAIQGVWFDIRSRFRNTTAA